MSHKALIRRFHIHSLLFEDSGRPWSRPLREEPVVMTYDAGYIKSGSWFIMFLKSQPAAQLRQCVNRTAIKRSVTCHQSCLYSETSLPSAVVIRFHPQTVQEYHSLYMCQSNSADTCLSERNPSECARNWQSKREACAGLLPNTAWSYKCAFHSLMSDRVKTWWMWGTPGPHHISGCHVKQQHPLLAHHLHMY